ncbi:Mnd1 family-domain-containing protein [Schizophyllum commune]
MSSPTSSSASANDTRAYVQQLIRAAKEDPDGRNLQALSFADFIKLMQELGFNCEPPEKGRLYHFIPWDQPNKPFRLHNPHPDPTITSGMLREVAIKLLKTYGRIGELEAPRGLSAEEKRVKMLEIFHETKDFFQLKELEKIAPKTKGIVSQSVKEVVQSLVDDGLVQSDKIGSSNFFWSFPSQHGAAIQARLSIAQAKRAEAAQQLKEVRASVEEERASRRETEERRAKLGKLAWLKQHQATLQIELSAYGTCDPIKIEEMKRAVTLAQEAAIRWTGESAIVFTLAHSWAALTTFLSSPSYRMRSLFTNSGLLCPPTIDNYSVLESYVRRQTGAETSDIRQHLGVDDEYEDIC